jgi:hypothetical protein
MYLEKLEFKLEKNYWDLETYRKSYEGKKTSAKCIYTTHMTFVINASKLTPNLIELEFSVA